MNAQLLHDPFTRASVIIDLLSKLPTDDMVTFDRLMAMPPVTPTPERIGDVNDRVQQKGFTLKGKPGHTITFAYYAGLGCMLIYTSPAGTDIWVDPLPGEGMRARRDYLEASVKLFYAEQGRTLEVFENGKPVETKAPAVSVDQANVN